MQNQRLNKDWLPQLAGLTALAGFFLPFDGPRSLFRILEHNPLPFFSPTLVLLLVLALFLREYRPAISLFLTLWLLVGWLFLLGLLLWRASLPVLVKNLGPGALLLSLALPVMALSLA